MLIFPLPRFYGTVSKLVVAFVVPVMVWTGEIFTELVRLRLLTVTIRYDTRCYFNVRSKADISQLNLPHGTDN